MQLLNEFITTTLAEGIANMNKARSVIQQFVSPTASYEDLLLRVAGYTNGISIPNKNKDKRVDIIPVLDALADAGLVQRKSNGAYKRGDSVGKLISAEANNKTTKAIGGDNSKDGRLAFTQTNQMGYMGNSGETGEVLDAAPRNYKAGGRYSGQAKEFIIKSIKEKDHNWKSLSGTTKQMIAKLATIENPLYSFRVLKAVMAKRDKKKGYTDFSSIVKDTFNDQAYIDALYDLESIGLLDAKSGTLNTGAVKELRNAIEFFKEPPVDGITRIDKLSALLPKFAANATAHSATTHRSLNNLVTNPKYKTVINIINTRLNDDVLADILATPNNELTSPIKRSIKFLASKLDADTVDDLKAAITVKQNNRADFKGDANIDAKNAGRFDFFVKNFDI